MKLFIAMQPNGNAIYHPFTVWRICIVIMVRSCQFWSTLDCPGWNEIIFLTHCTTHMYEKGPLAVSWRTPWFSLVVLKTHTLRKTTLNHLLSRTKAADIFQWLVLPNGVTNTIKSSRKSLSDTCSSPKNRHIRVEQLSRDGTYFGSAAVWVRIRPIAT